MYERGEVEGIGDIAMRYNDIKTVQNVANNVI
jgi:hypothetical protein